MTPNQTVAARWAFAEIAVALSAMAFVFAVDHGLKHIMTLLLRGGPIEVTPFFNLSLGYNPGISFGLFQETLVDWPNAFSFFKIFVAVALLCWGASSRSVVEAAAFGMIAGGAIGNAVDRLMQGAVTDFLDFHICDWHWPTFNMADVGIVVGVGLLLWRAIVTVRS